MFKDNLLKIKDILKIKEGENSKKKIENLAVFIIILIITIIIINTIWNSDKDKEKEDQSTYKILANTDNNNEDNNKEKTQNELEERLENILENIKGVGKVKVLLTYSQSSQTVAMYNEDSTKNDTQETDTQGGNRNISQYSSKKEIIYQEIDGKKVPVTQSIIEPKIEGAIVTAVGAQNINIKTNIIQAVEAATGLATHKIQVFEMID